jgi:hypothetical protein
MTSTIRCKDNFYLPEIQTFSVIYMDIDMNKTIVYQFKSLTNDLNLILLISNELSLIISTLIM